MFARFFVGVGVFFLHLGWSCCGVAFSSLLLGGVVLSPFSWWSFSLLKDNSMVQTN